MDSSVSLQFEYLILIYIFESPWWTLFGLFDSPWFVSLFMCVGMEPHLKEGVKHDNHNRLI